MAHRHIQYVNSEIQTHWDTHLIGKCVKEKSDNTKCFKPVEQWELLDISDWNINWYNYFRKQIQH